jgi:hypothetical protein
MDVVKLAEHFNSRVARKALGLGYSTDEYIKLD